jgi:hypothetical protein
VKRGKCWERWYRRGRTEAVAQDSGVLGVGDELRWSVEVVAGSWSTGKQRGSEERRKFWQKNPGEAELTMRPRCAVMAAPKPALWHGVQGLRRVSRACNAGREGDGA